MSSKEGQRVRIVESGMGRLSRPTMLFGVPEVGLVGTIASAYLIDKLQLPEIGYIDSELIPQLIVIRKHVPKHPVRVFGRGNLAMVLSEVPLTARLANEMALEVVRWSKSISSPLVIGISGIPSKERESESGKAPEVFAVTNDDGMAPSLKRAGAQPFEDGLMVGTYAALMNQCMLQEQTNVTLLGEALAQFPDPGAAAAVIGTVNRLLGLKVDVKPLIAESEEIRVKSRELMNSTQQAMQVPQGSLNPYK